MIDFNEAPTQTEVERIIREAMSAKPDPAAAFRSAMAEHGLDPGEIVPDGALTRFDVKPGDKAGWYVFHLDGIPAGAFGNWRAGLDQKWCSKTRQEVSAGQWAEHERRMAEAKRQREEARRLEHEAARARLWAVYEKAGPAHREHPYLKRKGVRAYDGIRQAGDVLLVPMRDGSGQYWGHQEIYPEKRPFAPGGEPRDKTFPKGTRKQGCSFTIAGDEKIFICEGYATGASVHEATGGTVIIAFDAGNLFPVARSIRERYPHGSITVCGDDDRWHPERGNPGREKAEAAAKSIGASATFPRFKDESGRPSDWNDLACLEGIEAVRGQIRGMNRGGYLKDALFTVADFRKISVPLKVHHLYPCCGPEAMA